MKWIFRVRVYFNPSPEVDDLHIVETALPKESAKLRSTSYLLTDLFFRTTQKYTLQWSETGPVRNLAWQSTSSIPDHMLDCRKNPGGCRTDPKRSIPQRDLLTNSTENIGFDLYYDQLKWTEWAVQARLKKVVIEKSNLWNPSKMGRESAERTNALVNWPTVTTTGLFDSLNRYSEKFLLAKNLLLIGAYHENSMSLCLQELDQYSPAKVVEAATDQMLEEQSVLSDFKPRLIAALQKCTAHDMKPELRQLQAQLEELLTIQSRSK